MTKEIKYESKEYFSSTTTKEVAKEFNRPHRIIMELVNNLTRRNQNNAVFFTRKTDIHNHDYYRMQYEGYLILIDDIAKPEDQLYKAKRLLRQNCNAFISDDKFTRYKNLRYIRLIMGLTQTEFGKKLNLKSSVISAVERGYLNMYGKVKEQRDFNKKEINKIKRLILDFAFDKNEEAVKSIREIEKEQQEDTRPKDLELTNTEKETFTREEVISMMNKVLDAKGIQ